MVPMRARNGVEATLVRERSLTNPERVMVEFFPTGEEPSSVTTLSGLARSRHVFPRAARASQPWAEGCNPVGIERPQAGGCNLFEIETINLYDHFWLIGLPPDKNAAAPSPMDHSKPSRCHRLPPRAELSSSRPKAHSCIPEGSSDRSPWPRIP